MFWTVLALALTVFMGAIIAYWGDLIGRKYGKKRLSWFGLRPKYTAILITSISGALISTLTIAVLILLVKPVRDIITDGEYAIRHLTETDRKRKEAEGKYVEIQAKLGPTEARLAQLITQLEGEKTRLSAAHAQLAAVERDRGAAVSERDKALLLKQRAMSLVAQVTARLGELKKQQAALTANNTQLAEANIALHDKNLELTGANEALGKRNATLIAENQRQIKLNAEYTQQNAEVARQNENLVRDNGRLTKLREDLEKQRIDITQRTKDLSDYNAQLEERNARLIASTRQLLGGYKNLRDAYNASRAKRVVVHKDEDLARIVVPARSTPEKVRSLVQNLLSDASQAAVARGAAAGDQARAVQVANRYIAAGEDGDVPVAVSGDERVDELVRKLAYQQMPMCIQAVAVANSVEEEPAAIELVPSPNREVFSRGQQIGMTRIEAGKPVEKLFDDVVMFLHGVGQSAVQQGMIPRLDPSGEPQVGSLTAAEIAKLVERIRGFNGTVRIRAVAASDINAADALALDFKVEP